MEKVGYHVLRAYHHVVYPRFLYVITFLFYLPYNTTFLRKKVTSNNTDLKCFFVNDEVSVTI